MKLNLNKQAARSKADAGLNQAIATAERKHPDWAENAYKFFKRWLSRKPSGYRFQTPTPDQPGVYALRVVPYSIGKKYLAYIGSSQNLKKRRENHPVIKKLYELHPSGYLVQFMFKEVPQGYLDYERFLIKRLKPKFNIHHTGIL